MRRKIIAYNSEKEKEERFCDVIVDDGRVDLQVKQKDKFVTISWEDVKDQVKIAKKQAEEITKKLSQPVR